MKFFAVGLWTIAVIATGYTLFYITFEVEALEAELTKLNRQILAEQESVHILKAEWSYLNRPGRLGKLTHRLLPELDGLSASQIGELAELPERALDEEDSFLSDATSKDTNIYATPVSLEVR